MSQQSGNNGFTALELLVAMGIVAVVLALAVPSFRNHGWNLRMNTAMDTLRGDMTLARGRAISHNVSSVVCTTGGGDQCIGSSAWQHGWIVFSDLNADRKRQTGEPLLKRGNPVESLTISSSRSRTQVRFLPDGSAPGSNLSIAFCDKRGVKSAGKLTVSNTGRVRTAKGGSMPGWACP